MVKLIAHRGESASAPENTLESFRLAWQNGARAIEGDFFLTKDGEIVCHHDVTTLRTAGVNRKVTDQTFAELCALDVGQWYGPQWHCRIPTLREVLDTMPDYGEIYIELKCGSLLLDALERLFSSNKWRPEQLTFLAASPEVKERFPGHQVLWCIGNYDAPGAGGRWTPAELLKKAKEMKADGVDIWYGAGITSDYIHAMHDNGLSIHAWTVDIPWDAQQLEAAGVDSITSNRAAALGKEMVSRIW